MTPAVDQQTAERFFALYDDDPNLKPRVVDAVGASIVRVTLHQVDIDAEAQHVYELDAHGEIVHVETRT